MAGVLGIKSFDAVLLGSVLFAMAAAVPIRLVCVRYVGIFFGMLTLAFGMLSLVPVQVLPPHRRLSGMRARMNILGLEFAQYNKIEFWPGRSITTVWLCS